jgi:hypothetical protein
MNNIFGLRRRNNKKNKKIRKSHKSPITGSPGAINFQEMAISGAISCPNGHGKRINKIHEVFHVKNSVLSLVPSDWFVGGLRMHL